MSPIHYGHLWQNSPGDIGQSSTSQFCFCRMFLKYECLFQGIPLVICLPSIAVVIHRWMVKLRFRQKELQACRGIWSLEHRTAVTWTLDSQRYTPSRVLPRAELSNSIEKRHTLNLIGSLIDHDVIASDYSNSQRNSINSVIETFVSCSVFVLN